jgi:hypothetical protein
MEYDPEKGQVKGKDIRLDKKDNKEYTKAEVGGR